jgi:hypothetical protein
VPRPVKPDATVNMPSDEESADREFVAIWPATAYGSGTDGQVTLSCLVDVHGLAEHCEVAAERPAGKGFGKAALQMRPLIQLAPAKDADGKPMAAQMSIRINFKAPKKDLVGTQEQHADAEARARSPGGGLKVVMAVNPIMGNPLPMQTVTLIDDPQWAAAPNFDDLARAYPSKGGGVEGYAVPHCEVVRGGATAGRLRNCDVIKENPPDRGFAKAALSLTAKFRIDPAALARAPHGAPLWVNIPVRLSPPGPQAEREVMAPTWISGLDPTATPKIFPPEAAQTGVTTGRGVARCQVAADGTLSACAPEDADPEGLGFSEAAVKLASTLKMNLWSQDGAPVEGGVIRVPIRLNLKPALTASR